MSELVKDQKTALVEYVVTGERTYLFVLTRRDRDRALELKAYAAAINQSELAARVSRFHRMMAENNPGFLQRSRELYDLLIKTAEPQLRGKERLCVIPDGVLWDAPFQALQAGNNRFLIEGYAIYYAPSLSLLREVAKREKANADSSSPTLLAFANPVVGTDTVARLQDAKRGESFEPLPEAEVEARTLAQIFGPGRSAVFVGAKADERVFKSLAPKYRVIHFATHGVIDDRQPLYSYLLLSKAEGDQNDDGLLEAREIMNLNLRADLAVLSACETARGRIGAGEGVVGMSWAFFAAGCRATVVSQWKVNSAGASDLMIAFYRNLKKPNGQDRMSKAGALRAAALEMMKDYRYRHPFHWAAFIVVGGAE